jgi:transcriptional regulator with XRE-family HTH domain
MAKSPQLHKRSTTSQDREIGRRLKIRRLELGMSQSALGDALEISFQQIQKYEKADNRIGSGRLQQIAKILKVPTSFFFGEDREGARTTHATFDLLNTAYSLRLVKAFTRIKDPRIQKSTVEFVEKLADAFDSGAD